MSGRAPAHPSRPLRIALGWRPLKLRAAALTAVLLFAGCAGASASGGGCSARVTAAGARGEFAFVSDGGVSVVDLPSCRTRVLASFSDAKAPLRFSADGRYLAYGDGQVIATAGSAKPRRPLGRTLSWAWSPTGARLAGATAGGGVALWSPGGARRQLVPEGWGASAVAFAPRGDELAVARSTTSGAGGEREDELYSLDLTTGKLALVYALHGVGDLNGGIAGFTPEGKDVLFWPDTAGSASIAADGLPLDAVPLAGGPRRTLVPRMLTYDDYVAACHGGLAVTAGSFRESNVDKTLVRLPPPSFHAESLHLSKAESWTTPSCSAGGEIAAAAGPSRQERHFGLERRSIWLLRSGHAAQRLTQPRANVTDELPRISANGRYVLFVRTQTNAQGLGTGTLELISLRGGAAKVVGPIARVGTSGSYYGHYRWAESTAWHAGG